MTQFIFSIFTIFLSASAMAAPEAITGTFRSQRDLQIISHRENEVVYIATEEGRRRLQELQNDSYTCSAINSSTYKCYKFIHNGPIPEGISQEIKKIQSEIYVSFKALPSGIEQTNESEYLKEWQLTQNIESNFGDVNFYNYYELKKGPQKIKIMPKNGLPVWFLVDVLGLTYVFGIKHQSIENQNHFTDIVASILLVKQ